MSDSGEIVSHGEQSFSLEVQAVGGVTRKIEGFFAVCQARALTGAQGVVIPTANVPHLMLNDDIVQAVRAGMFHVWAIRTIEEGLELLTGRPAGKRGSDGQYLQGSVHRLVADRLRHYAEQLRSFAAAPSPAPTTSADGDGRILRESALAGSRDGCLAWRTTCSETAILGQMIAQYVAPVADDTAL